MSNVKRETWRCQPCRSDSGASVYADTLSHDSCFAEQFSAVNERLHSLLSTVERLATKLEDLLSLKTAVVEIQESIDPLSANYDKVVATMNANKAEIAVLNAQAQSVATTVDDHAEPLERLTPELNQLEQYTHRCNFEIHGLAFQPKENLSSIVCELALKLVLNDISATDIAAVHRLPSGPNKIAPILVQVHKGRRKEQCICAHKAFSAGGRGYVSSPLHQREPDSR
ncbi:hypothetical protein HPB48_004572 [Haemaphysalis longicornis]|uniref:Uncharacterized protein n=1 Tax=Haemaphysalis longicornis TaxID=44386 RepID=A0A9J6FEU8_HAELO|nr:hypothetical protein HPB48_004572 [Haemaphysalis longicornis]